MDFRYFTAEVLPGPSGELFVHFYLPVTACAPWESPVGYDGTPLETSPVRAPRDAAASIWWSAGGFPQTLERVAADVFAPAPGVVAAQFQPEVHSWFFTFMGAASTNDPHAIVHRFLQQLDAELA